MKSNILSFQELPASEWAVAGGKGGSLCKLHQAGFPVPDGFVILPAAFVDDDLAPAAWAQVRVRLNELRTAGDPPDTLRPVPLAIRSSAMAEDSAQASFAGEFETVLNVRTDEEVRDAIRRVYRSRQTERVQAYTRVRGIQPSQADGLHEISVIVQRLVPAEVSGIMFTAHPVSGALDQVLINASWGLGEAIVSGRVTPDMLTVDKASRRVEARHTADKTIMTVRSGSGVVDQPVPEASRRAAVLSDAQAIELAELGEQIESLYGLPMDIEWTLADGAFSIVQARPITALPGTAPQSQD
jgi:pyruvate,water dikinase